MNNDEARRIVSSIPAEQHRVLADAYSRYMHFTGVWCGDGFPEAQIEADRAAYPHLLQYGENGIPALSDKRCAEFMAAVSGLSVEWCLAWDAVEFENEHGNFDELVAKAQRAAKLTISVELEAQHDLSVVRCWACLVEKGEPAYDGVREYCEFHADRYQECVSKS